jgi:hypothetical protein
MSFINSARRVTALGATVGGLAVAGLAGSGALAPVAHAQNMVCQSYANQLAALQRELNSASSGEKPSIIREEIQVYEAAGRAGCNL